MNHFKLNNVTRGKRMPRCFELLQTADTNAKDLNIVKILFSDFTLVFTISNYLSDFEIISFLVS